MWIEDNKFLYSVMLLRQGLMESVFTTFIILFDMYNERFLHNTMN